MFEVNIITILVILTGIILLALPFVNNFYQKRGNDFADNLLKDIPEEYNKQIKGNAFRYLIKRSLFGLFICSSFVWNFRAILESGLNRYIVIGLFCGVLSIIWGIYGFKSELKKLAELK
jgi:hypothetical protein